MNTDQPNRKEDDLTTREANNIKILLKKMDVDGDIESLAADCLQACKKRKKAKSALKNETYAGLVLVYRAFIRVSNVDREFKKFAKRLGIDQLNTSGKLLNAIVKKTIGCGRKYASKLCTVLRYALKKEILPENLIKFVKKQRGIDKAAAAYRKYLAKKNHGESGPQDDEPRDTVKLFVARDKDKNRIDDLVSKSERLNKAIDFKASLRVEPTGEIHLVKLIESEG